MQKPTILFKPEDLTTALEAAKYLGVHFTTVYRWLKNGTLHPVHIVGQDYLSIDEVKTLKKKLTKKQKATEEISKPGGLDRRQPGNARP